MISHEDPRLVIHIAPKFTDTPLAALVNDFPPYHEIPVLEGENDQAELASTLPPWLIDFAECLVP